MQLIIERRGCGAKWMKKGIRRDFREEFHSSFNRSEVKENDKLETHMKICK